MLYTFDFKITAAVEFQINRYRYDFIHSNDAIE